MHACNVCMNVRIFICMYASIYVCEYACRYVRVFSYIIVPAPILVCICTRLAVLNFSINSGHFKHALRDRLLSPNILLKRMICGIRVMGLDFQCHIANLTPECHHTLYLSKRFTVERNTLSNCIYIKRLMLGTGVVHLRHWYVYIRSSLRND